MNNDVSVQLGLICRNCGKRLKHTAGKKEKFFARTNAENNIGIYMTEEKYD